VEKARERGFCSVVISSARELCTKGNVKRWELRVGLYLTNFKITSETSVTKRKKRGPDFFSREGFTYANT
jgi:hypothetical protein